MKGAILDACVLYPATLRDFLLRLAQAGVYAPFWSETILEECFRSVQRDRPDLSASQLARTRKFMNDAFEEALVTGHETGLETYILPDPDDRHVLAAAVHSGATWIVTFNLRDFPERALEPLGIQAIHPDAFVLACLEHSPDVVLRVLHTQQDALIRPRPTLEELLGRLQEQGLIHSIAGLRERLGGLK